MPYPPKVLSRLSTGKRTKKTEARRTSNAGERRYSALFYTVLSSDVAGLAALLDEAKLHSNNSEHAAKYLLGVSEDAHLA